MPPLRVGLNLIYLVPGETGGMEVYARELIPALLAADPALELVAFVNREAAAAGGPWSELCRAVTVPVHARRRTEWVRGEQLLLPGLARGERVSLVHSLASTAPARGDFVRVTTIHDLTYRLGRGVHFGLTALGMRVLVPLAARRSQRIITASQRSREEIVAGLGLAAEKVDVVPHGFGRVARASPSPEGELRARLGAGSRPVVLTVSAKRAHKNLMRLLEAWRLLEAPRPLLVLPGYATPHEKQLRARAREAGLQDDVRFLSWISDGDLEGLYALATCCVLPSLNEGFGLPVLEAMSRGVPVACSGVGAPAEVAGEAAALFDPGAPADIARAVAGVLGDPVRAGRLRALGRERVNAFSWQASARGTLASYARALA